MIRYLLLSLCFFINESLAITDQTKKDVKVLADTMNGAVPKDVGDVPGYVGVDVPQANLDSNTIETAKVEAAQKDDPHHTHQMIRDSIEKRQPYTLDVVDDPMIKKSNKHLAESKEITPSEDEAELTRPSWEPNKDMADTLSKLSVFKEMQKDMDPHSQVVFKGEHLQCSRSDINDKNCCKDSGWGVDLGLASCSAEEKQLGDLRQKNRCIDVGSYCKKRVWGLGCRDRRVSFCCYKSVLSKTINEQGTRQLGLRFGDPKNPNCKLMRVSNITRIDFKRINLSEAVQSIANQSKVPNVSKLTKDIGQSMADRSRLLNDKQNKMTQGKSNDNF